MQLKTLIFPAAEKSIPQYWLVLILVMAIGSLVGLVSFESLRTLQKEKAETEFTNKSDDLSLILQRSLDNELEALYTLKGLFTASVDVNRDEFENFSSKILRFHPSIRTLGWAPIVEHSERQIFEQEARLEGFTDYTIRERDDMKGFKTSEQREIYLPVQYLEPLKSDQILLGFDLFASKLIKDQVDLAVSTGQPVATGRINYNIFPGSPVGFSLILPLFENSNDTFPNKKLNGVVAGIYEIDKVVQSSLAGLMEDLHISLFDIGNSPNPIKLYSTKDNYDTPDEIRAERITHETELDVVGRKWLLVICSKQMLLENEKRALPWLVLSLIIVFSAMSSIFLAYLINSRQVIASKVEQQVSVIRQNEKKLIEINAELEEFAYRTSHDLRAPIISSNRLLKVTHDSIVENDTKMAFDSLSHAQNSLSKLEQLIVDILTLTEVGNKNEDEEQIDINQVIDDILTKLSNLHGFGRISFKRELLFTEELFAKPSRFIMIVENLISNAIKYQDYGHDDPYILIRTKKLGDRLILEVEDSGLGIPKEHQGQMFSMFKRFHPKVADGSGLGLYMIKKSATILNGSILYIQIKKGSLFRLVLPLDNRDYDS